MMGWCCWILILNPRPKPRKINIFSKANWSSIAERNEKCNSHFQKDFANRSVETNWNLFKTHIHNMLKKHVPVKQLSLRFSLLWFDKKAKARVQRKQKIIQ